MSIKKYADSTGLTEFWAKVKNHVTGAISVKQDTLVDGINIKTVNNNSLLGSGDLDTSECLIVDVIYDTTTEQITSTSKTIDEIVEAYDNNILVIARMTWDTSDITTELKLTDVYALQDEIGSYIMLAFCGVSGNYSYNIRGSVTQETGQEDVERWEYAGISLLTPTSSLSPNRLSSGIISDRVKAVTQSSDDNSTNIATTAYVKNVVAVLPEPMIFKGSLGQDGTISTLPAASSSNEGFVYKVITAGTYASQTAKIGDTFISDGSNWILIPSGDEPSGTVTSIATGSGLSGGVITSSGTISLDAAYGDTINPYGTKTANYILAGPASGNATAPTFRALVANDLPNGNWLNGSQIGSVRTSGSKAESTEEGSTYVMGQYTTTEGYNTMAIGHYSHAEGDSTYTGGRAAHAEGTSTIARRKSQTAIGEYNIADTTGSSGGARGSYVFIIGNGTADDARSNALTVDWNGNIYMDVKYSGESGARTGIDANLVNALDELGWTNDVLV